MGILKKLSKATSPEHYQTGGIQVIEILEKKLSPLQFEGFLVGNTLKYLFRYNLKNGVEDLNKAKVYLQWLTEFKDCGKIEVID